MNRILKLFKTKSLSTLINRDTLEYGTLDPFTKNIIYFN